MFIPVNNNYRLNPFSGKKILYPKNNKLTDKKRIFGTVKITNQSPDKSPTMDIFQFLSLLIVSTFYASYLVKQISLKKQNIKTNRLLKGKKPKHTFRIELFLTIFTFIMPIVQYLSILFNNIPGSITPPLFLKTTGILISVTGLIYFLSAIIKMRNNWRAGIDETQKTNIVRTGIYSISRNPAFVGFDLIYIGTALSFPNIFTILFTVITIFIIHLQILEEEKFLISVFGKQYTEYKQKVKRY